MDLPPGHKFAACRVHFLHRLRLSAAREVFIYVSAQWVDLSWENLQETINFPVGYGIFLQFFVPFNESIGMEMGEVIWLASWWLSHPSENYESQLG